MPRNHEKLLTVPPQLHLPFTYAALHNYPCLSLTGAPPCTPPPVPVLQIGEELNKLIFELERVAQVCLTDAYMPEVLDCHVLVCIAKNI